MTDRTRAIADRLSPHLFWDIDKEQFDADTNSAQLIQRVLEYVERLACLARLLRPRSHRQ